MVKQYNKNMYFKIKWIVLALNAVIIQLQLLSVENTVLLKEATDKPHTDKKNTVAAQKCQENYNIKDPVIELKGGWDRCDGQLLISGVYRDRYSQAIMCDREPTPEMAEVICRQLKCGPPESPQPFSHVIKYIPSRKFIDNEAGFVCNGNERGLGYCNYVEPRCLHEDDALSLTCARPEPELISKSECRPVEYTPRPLHIINTITGDPYTCTPFGTIRLCPNIMDASGRFCRGPTTSERMLFKCIPKSGVGVPFRTAIHLTDHAQCMWK